MNIFLQYVKFTIAKEKNKVYDWYGYKCSREIILISENKMWTTWQQVTELLDSSTVARRMRKNCIVKSYKMSTGVNNPKSRET